MTRRITLIFAFMFTLGLGILFAQEAAPATEIDLPAEIEVAMAIFLTGIGGLSVTALVSLIKRKINAQGIAVIVISVVVSAAVVLIYLVPLGFVLWKFIVLTVVVTLAANGIYLTPQKRNT